MVLADADLCWQRWRLFSPSSLQRSRLFSAPPSRRVDGFYSCVPGQVASVRTWASCSSPNTLRKGRLHLTSRISCAHLLCASPAGVSCVHLLRAYRALPPSSSWQLPRGLSHSPTAPLPRVM